MVKYKILLLLFLALLLGAGSSLEVGRLAAQEVPEPNEPKIAEASNEGKLALEGFQVLEGVSGTLFAAEPMFANPVAFYVDDQGRVFVCETFRQGIGVVDNRDYDDKWVDADLAAQTVEDRRKYHLEQLSDEAAQRFVEEDDQIRVLIDTDKDGVADQSHVFAKHFNDLVDGTGAGVLVYRGNVYYTCIPSLYLMRDEDGDLEADGRSVLHSGYGVRVAFRGHDLHGLIVGPDGRLYFSIGDRGANIETAEGKVVNYESGSVFRCELDGSKLELFATGLRNPQELAFDEHGNLFTGDNNSDSGDQARWVYVVEGGDTGWRMAYQYLPDRGPFNRERIWEPLHEGQPFYIMPPIANFADGPSGLDYYPGTGFGDTFRGQFLLADFRGTASMSGIRTIRNEPDGAFFKIAEDTQPFWNILATDLQFGPDGALYVSDWVNGWNGEGKGRLYRFTTDDRNEGLVRQVQDFLFQDIARVPSEELAEKLQHVDQRVRQKAQLELAERGERAILTNAATQGASIIEQLHGVWGLDHLARRKPETLASASQIWLALCRDDAPEVRTHAVRLLGEFGQEQSQQVVLSLLGDQNARVRHFALMAVGKLNIREALPAVLQGIADNAGRDPVLRHAGIMALVGIADEKALVELTEHASEYVRLSAVVALRRLESSAVAGFLGDSSELVVAEAARAIHDVPILEAIDELAELIQTSPQNESIARRVLDANYRLGRAEAIAAYIADEENPVAMRAEGIAMLGAWAEPSGRDRVTGLWRPISARPAEPAKQAVEGLLSDFNSPQVALRLELGKTASNYGLVGSADLLRALYRDEAMDASSRAAALRAMGRVGVKQEDVDAALSSGEAQIRAAALTLLRRAMPDKAAEMLGKAALTGSIAEQQIALQELNQMRGVSERIVPVLQKWSRGELAPEVYLEALETAERRRFRPEIKELLETINPEGDGDQPIDAYRVSMFGGDVEAGRKIFAERVSLSCVRCHKVAGVGGEVGPDLSRIGLDKKRDYLLEAIVDPNKVIAKGFESAVLLDEDDQVHTGVVRAETEDSITLIDAEGVITEFAKEEIVARNPGKSGMPADLIKNLSKRELRDLIEYLASLDGTQEVKQEVQ